MKKKQWFALTALILALCLALCACGEEGEGDVTASPDASEPVSEGTVLAAPTDFTMDPNTGAFSFTANDANAGYYFIRVFPVVNGEEGAQYVASSSRINGNNTGTQSGTIDVSTIGWGEYHVKLITYAASGSGYTAPDAVILDAYYGVGGTLEKPEMMAMVDGGQVEFVIDWYSLSDYYSYQYMPQVTFSIYADPACTDLVLSDTVDTTVLTATMDTHPTGAYMWGYTTTSDHMYFEGQFGFLHDLYAYTLDAGTYYAVCQAISSDESVIASSQVSDVLEITLTGGGPSGTFSTVKTALWQDPTIMGMPTAASGAHPDRVDFGQTQSTTATIG